MSNEKAVALADSKRLHDLVAAHGGTDYKGDIMITFGRLLYLLADYKQQREADEILDELLP